MVRGYYIRGDCVGIARMRNRLATSWLDALIWLLCVLRQESLRFFLLDLLPRLDARLSSWPLRFSPEQVTWLQVALGGQPTALAPGTPPPNASLTGDHTASGSATAAACRLQRPTSGTLSSPASSLLSGTYHV